MSNRIQRFAHYMTTLTLLVCLSAEIGATTQNMSPVASPATAAATKGKGEVITIVGDDWCPYNCEPGSEQPGYMIEVATEVFQQAGYRVNYKSVPWVRAITGVEKGTYHAAVGAAKGDIPSAMFPDNELGWMQNAFFVRPGFTWKYNGIESLQSVRLGVVGGYFYSDELNAYIEKNRQSDRVVAVFGDNAVERNLTKLIENKIDGSDVYIEDASVVSFTLNKLGLDKNSVELAGKLDEPDTIYIAFTPKHAQSEKWARILSDGIQELRQNGRLAEILQRYGLKDWK